MLKIELLRFINKTEHRTTANSKGLNAKKHGITFEKHRAKFYQKNHKFPYYSKNPMR